MSLTYAIPDIHGRDDLLETALDAIIRHSMAKPATIVALGDYVDRGPSSRQVIERLMGWRSEKCSLVCLKGNHEAMMWETCSNLAELGWWLKNGGDRTLGSYTENSGRLDPGLVPHSHLDWIADLALMHVDKHRVYVHAAVDPTVSLSQQSIETLLWKRYPDGYKLGHGARHVVHGHHAQLNAPVVTGNKTNLDGMAWKTGRLVIGIFDDNRPGEASDFLEVVGEPSE